MTEKLEDLVVRAQVGDQEAYSTIVQRFQEMAFSYAYSILGDYELAEDARQEAFLGAYCDLLTLKNPAAFPGWFRTIVRKHSINFIRGRRGVTVPLEEVGELASAAPDPARLAEKGQERQQLLRAIGRLPAHEREVTSLFYLEELSLKEIGERTGLPVKTIKSRLHVARARLRQRLMEMVKKSVQAQTLAGDKRPGQTASALAISQFEEQIAALLHVPTAEELRRAGDLICAKGRLQRFMGRPADALATFEAGLVQAPLNQDPLWCARLRAEIGLTHVHSSDYPLARKELEAALKVVRRASGQEELRAAILNGLGLCAWGEGQFRQARKFYEETADLCREARSPCLEAEARNNLSLLDWKAGELEPALEGFRLGLRRWKKLGNRFGAALTLMNIGIIEENLGRPLPARRHYGEALELAGEVNFVQVQAACYANLGNLALVQERWDEALEHNRRALELARQIGDRRSQAIALENLALTYGGLAQPADARQALREGRKLARAIGDLERLFSLELVEIEALLAGGQAEGTRERLLAARRQLDEQGYLAELPRLLRLHMQAELLTGVTLDAGRTLELALRESRRQKNRVEEQRLLTLARRIPGALGQAD